MKTPRQEATCCVAGGGPAGVVAGLLLARQAVQTRILRGLYPKTLDDDARQRTPIAVKLFKYVPSLRHLTGRFIGMGLRPEHIRA